MAAALVYEGVVGGGDLFQGMKLYILQRVPDRNRWKGLVEGNGGEIVILEKQADMIIADRARKDCPPGSISWHWIDQSVKKGELEDIELYRAGPATNIIREVGAAQPARKGRTQFTAEDDRILRDWCIKAERKGVSMKGNELYKQLEAKYPRHTFQSWRDRWIKYVSLQPRPQLPGDNDEEEEEEEEEDGVPTNRRTVTQRLSSRAASSQPRPVASSSTAPVIAPPVIQVTEGSRAVEKTVPRSSPGLPSSPFVAKTAESAGGNIFTEEETEVLLEVYDDILDLREDATIDAWMTWASVHPNHTAQEWRNYFTEYLVPRQRAQKESKRVVPPSEPSPPANIMSKGSPERHESPSNREVRDSRDSAGQVLESQKRVKRAADPTTTNEKLFKHHVSILAESFELVVDFEPTICGRPLPLFKLWQVVQSEEFGGFDEVNGRNLWPQVARKLNFNDWRHASAAADLKDCYSEILADFEEVREEEREENGLTESQEEALIKSQLQLTAARETQPTSADEGDEEDDEIVEEEEELEDDLDAPQSSPRIIPSSSSKRSFGTDRTNQPISYNKRQRIDKGKGKELEIPSTPEDLINHNQKIRPSHQPSPLKYSSPHEPDLYGESSEDELFVKQINFPKPKSKPPPQPQILEPETQDFHFPPELDNEDKNSWVEISPSPPPQSQHQQHSSNGTSNAATHGTAHSTNQWDSSTQSQTESQRAAEIEEFINHHVALGIPQDIVISALEATTMEPGISSPVMESLMNGDGIPENIAGVWTSWDDDALEAGVESEEYKALIRKHGIKRIGLRKRFLRDSREVQAEVAQRLAAEGGQATA